jgi:hypothetical protein
MRETFVFGVEIYSCEVTLDNIELICRKRIIRGLNLLVNDIS